MRPSASRRSPSPRRSTLAGRASARAARRLHAGLVSGAFARAAGRACSTRACAPLPGGLRCLITAHRMRACLRGRVSRGYRTARRRLDHHRHVTRWVSLAGGRSLAARALRSSSARFAASSPLTPTSRYRTGASLDDAAARAAVLAERVGFLCVRSGWHRGLGGRGAGRSFTALPAGLTTHTILTIIISNVTSLVTLILTLLISFASSASFPPTLPGWGLGAFLSVRYAQPWVRVLSLR